jgi:hypothetical protein
LSSTLVFILLIGLIVAVTIFSIAVRGLVLFPIRLVRHGFFQAFTRYGESFLFASFVFLICVINTTSFSWRHFGRVNQATLVETSIDYAYGTRNNYTKVLSEHFPGYVAKVDYFFEYSKSSELYQYGFWDKVFGDDTYQVMLPEWRVLLDKHGNPYEKQELSPSGQPSRSNNLFGLVVYFENENRAGPVLMEGTHLQWQSGEPSESKIKRDCVAFLTTSERPRVAVYRAQGTEFSNFVTVLDADTYGYGLKLLKFKRTILSGSVESKVVEQPVSRKEFEKLAMCE